MTLTRSFVATTRWIGARSDGWQYQPDPSLRPQIRFPSIPELDGREVLWDAFIEDVLEFDAAKRDGTIKFSLSPQAPADLIVQGATFTLSDARKVIAEGEVISIQN